MKKNHAISSFHMSITVNIFTLFLEQLNVKHTNHYANRLFNEHPDKYNLLGLSDMLTAYGIENAGFKVEQKESICTATPPFIAFAGGDFVIVEAINTQQTRYAWNGKRIEVATNEFLKIWSGAYIGYLLLLKHLHIHGGYGDRICSLFKQADCNNILDSSAAKLCGVISWSEIGLGHFISNTAIILFFPHLITGLALINIFALPYSFWSIWYQGIKVKQWCPLCAVV